MDKEMQLKLKLAMNQLESACEAMELVVEACCPEETPSMPSTKGMRNKMLMVDTGSSTEE